MNRDERNRLVYEIARQHAQGRSIRRISHSLGVARQTVRRALQELEERREQGDPLVPPATRQKSPRASKLDRHRDFIAGLVERYPNIRATRLHEELKEKGFDGGYTIVRHYLNSIRPKRAPRAYKIVETGPGEQGQVDWSPYKLSDGTPVYAFSNVLSYSRYQYLHFCTDMRQPTLFQQLRRSFEYHGGVAREYVFDSMPGIVDRWELDRPVLNLRAVDFAAYYNIALHIAPRGDGAYKGKVERPFRFVEESLFNAREFHTVSELNEFGAKWLKERCNARLHRRIGQRPVDALADENLRPLPAHPYDDRELTHRIVDSYSYVRFDGNFYRVSSNYIGHIVYIRASDTEVTIVGGAATVLARHPRGTRNAKLYIPSPDTHSRPRRRSATELVACFEIWGPTAHRFAQRVRDKQRYAAAELAHLLEIRQTWSVEDILHAIEHATRYAAYSTDAIERILEATAKPRPFADILAEGAREHIRQAMATSPVKQRGLAVYARLLSGPDNHSDAPLASHGDEHEHSTDSTNSTDSANSANSADSISDPLSDS